MHFPRLPDWLVYGSIVLALLFAALGRQERADAPPPPPPLPAAEGAALAQSAPFDPLAVGQVRRRFGGPAGTAFSVGDAGVWLTARGAVEACAHPVLLVGAGQGVAAKAAAYGDLAVLTTPGGAPALPLAGGEPRKGALAYVAGFPRGRPGEIALRYLGPETLHRRDRQAPDEPVLVWAEIGRTEGLKGSLIGIAGAPALDGEGRVVGVVLGEAPRRGRLYSTAPGDMAAALAAAGAKPPVQAAGQPITPDNYGLAADDLRRTFQAAQTACAAK